MTTETTTYATLTGLGDAPALVIQTAEYDGPAIVTNDVHADVEMGDDQDLDAAAAKLGELGYRLVGEWTDADDGYHVDVEAL